MWRSIQVALLGALLLSQMSRADCIRSDSARLSASVFGVLQDNRAVAAGAGGATTPLALTTGAVVAGAAIGLGAGQLINLGLSRWWDPEVEVFALDPAAIVKPIDDAVIDAAFGGLVGALDPAIADTLADVTALNQQAPGFGDAALQLVRSAVRSFVHMAQGAAAYAAHGAGAPDVVTAAQWLNADLDSYRSAMLTYAGYVDAFDASGSIFTRLTQAGFAEYLDSFQQGGPPDLPAELSLGNALLSLAGVQLRGVTLADVVIDAHLTGDFSSTAAEIGPGGLALADVMRRGTAAFRIDCTACDIARSNRADEPATLALLLLSAVAAVSARRRRGLGSPADRGARVRQTVSP